ncbi:MAG: hypothetical protein AB1567_08410 [bacterium]
MKERDLNKVISENHNFYLKQLPIIYLMLICYHKLSFIARPKRV